MNVDKCKSAYCQSFNLKIITRGFTPESASIILKSIKQIKPFNIWFSFSLFFIIIPFFHLLWCLVVVRVTRQCFYFSLHSQVVLHSYQNITFPLDWCQLVCCKSTQDKSGLRSLSPTKSYVTNIEILLHFQATLEGGAGCGLIKNEPEK